MTTMPVRLLLVSVLMVCVSADTTAECGDGTSPAEAGDTPSANLLEDIGHRWKEQRKEIRTAVVDLLYLSNGSDMLAVHDRDALLTALQIVRDHCDRSDFDSLCRAVLNEDANRTVPNGTVRLVIDGDSLREQTTLTSSSGVQTHSDRVQRGSLDAIGATSPDHAQLRLTDRKAQQLPGHLSLASIRYVPFFSLAGAELAHLSPTEATIVKPQAKHDIACTIQLPSAFSKSFEATVRDGQIQKGIWQFHPIQFKSGLILPSLMVDATFNPTGQLALLKMSFIQTAEINEPIADKEFELQATKGTIVFDERVPDAGRTLILNSDTTNVEDTLETIKKSRIVKMNRIPNTNQSRQWVTVVVFNVQLLAIILVLFSIRRTAK